MIYIDISHTEYLLKTDIVVNQRVSPDWKWDHHPDQWERDPAFLLWFVREGGADLLVDDELYHVKKGDVLLMPTHAHTYKGRHNQQRLFEVSWMIFSFVHKHDESPIVSQKIEGIPFYYQIHDVEFSIRLMDRIIETHGALRESWTRAFLHNVQLQVASKEESDLDVNMKKLIQTIQKNPLQFKGLFDMQPFLPVSKDHLIRLFRARVGITPMEFLIRARLDHAKSLLLMSSDSIKEIAFRVGYSDQFVFSRQFKDKIGMSPRDYRKKQPLW